MGPEREHIPLEELYEKAKRRASKQGYADWADDFASHYILKILEGQAQHQIMGYAFIDFLRGEFNPMRKIRAALQYYSIEEAKQYTPEDRIILFDLLKKYCTPVEDKMLYLYLIENYTLKEIANGFGISESRVSQRFKELASKAQRETRKCKV